MTLHHRPAPPAPTPTGCATPRTAPPARPSQPRPTSDDARDEGRPDTDRLNAFFAGQWAVRQSISGDYEIVNGAGDVIGRNRNPRAAIDEAIARPAH